LKEMLVPMFPPVFLGTIEAILSAGDIGGKSLRVGGVPRMLRSAISAFTRVFRRAMSSGVGRC
jgi:hypothetical protein